MDAREIASVVTDALKTRYPGMSLSGEMLDRESVTVDFEFGPDSGSISIEVAPEELLCIQCSGIATGVPKENLVPVTDGETFAITCVHNLQNLRNWRTLTEDERKDFDAGSESFIQLLRGELKKGGEQHGDN